MLSFRLAWKEVTLKVEFELIAGIVKSRLLLLGSNCEWTDSGLNLRNLGIPSVIEEAFEFVKSM